MKRYLNYSYICPFSHCFKHENEMVEKTGARWSAIIVFTATHHQRGAKTPQPQFQRPVLFVSCLSLALTW